MKVAYVRVSTAEQNEARQKEALSRYQIDKWYEEKVSGKSMDRPKLQEMLDYVREGDTVYVHDLSRLARSTSDLLKIVELLSEKNVHLVSNKENIDTSSATGKLLLTFIAAINQFERENLLERQREGIAIAKEAGKYKGRKKIERKNFENWTELYERFQQDRTFSKSEFARTLGISRNTLRQLLKEEAEERTTDSESSGKKKRKSGKKSSGTVAQTATEDDNQIDDDEINPEQMSFDF